MRPSDSVEQPNTGTSASSGSESGGGLARGLQPNVQRNTTSTGGTHGGETGGNINRIQAVQTASAKTYLSATPASIAVGAKNHKKRSSTEVVGKIVERELKSAKLAESGASWPPNTCRTAAVAAATSTAASAVVPPHGGSGNGGTQAQWVRKIYTSQNPYSVPDGQQCQQQHPSMAFVVRFTGLRD